LEQYQPSPSREQPREREKQESPVGCNHQSSRRHTGKKPRGSQGSHHHTSYRCGHKRIPRPVHVPTIPPRAPLIDPYQYVTDDEGSSPHEYSPTPDRHYTHAQNSEYNHSQFPTALPQAMNDRHPVTYPDPYTSHIPSGLSLPPIDISSQNSFQKPRSQGYYGGHGGAGRYYDQREKEIQQVGKDMRRWPPCAVAAPEAAHAGALRRNGSSASSSRGHGHGKEKERKEIPERPANERKSSRLVENCCSVGAREQGNPLRELEQLRFTPKVTAGTHLRRFERLAGMAYPGVSSGGKWYVHCLSHISCYSYKAAQKAR